MATKLLDKYIKEMREGMLDSVVIEGEEKNNSQDRLVRFKECADRNGTMEVYFTYANASGDLIAEDNHGVKVEFLAKDIKQDLPYYTPYYKDRFLNTPLVVRIISIDEENDVVHVRSGRSTGVSVKRRLVHEIEQEMKAREEAAQKDGSEVKYLEVVGRIEAVSPQRAIVNILGKGILGFCYSRNWQINHTRDLTEFCKKGDLADFQIIGKLPTKRGHEKGFNLSHAAFTEDAWQNIPATLFDENAVLTVECIEKPSGKNYWWGKADIAPGIEIQCNFNHNLGTIREGISYKCKIKSIDAENHRCRAVPFALAEKDRKRADAIRFIETKGKSRRKGSV